MHSSDPSPIDPRLYQFVILPGNLHEKRHLSKYYSQAYGHWKKIWQRVFKHIEGEEAFNPDDFLKQTNIFSIFYENEVVAQICSRVLSAEDEITPEIPYFKDIGQKVFLDLSDGRAKKIMTLEFNAINPLFSKRRTGFPFADALLFLCFEAARSLGVDCCTAVPRRITRVQETLTEMKFKTVIHNSVRFNCPIDVMLGYLEVIPRSPNAVIANFVESLWTRRIDHRSHSEPHPLADSPFLENPII